jgi:hypothetical protein
MANCTATRAPGASGCASGTRNTEPNPPPLSCVGGCVSFAPITLTAPAAVATLVSAAYGARSLTLDIQPIDPSALSDAAPNVLVDALSDSPHNATAGHIYIRRYIRNATDSSISALQ